MRSFIFVVMLAGACAHSSTGPQPINVAAVRSEINDTIRAQQVDRSIHSMGAVRETRAVVYTTASSGDKSEETWIKVDGTWKLETKTALK